MRSGKMSKLVDCGIQVCSSLVVVVVVVGAKLCHRLRLTCDVKKAHCVLRVVGVEAKDKQDEEEDDDDDNEKKSFFSAADAAAAAAIVA